MSIVESAIGTVADPIWQTRLEGATIDYLQLDQWEAQKSRFRKHTQGNIELVVSLDRNTRLHDGDILRWDEIQHHAIVVRIHLDNVMVIQLQELLTKPPQEMLRTCIELGHAIGNQHWPAIVKDTRIFVPLTVDQKVMASVMKTHAFSGIDIQFVPGADVIPYLAPHEARRLFGGTQQVHTHTNQVE